MRSVSLVGAAVVGSVVAVLAWAEWANWRASSRFLGSPSAAAERASEAVVVLGFSNRGRRANAINRYRVRAGLRSMNPRAARSVLVLCGGAVASDRTEAQLMADYARGRCGYGGPLLMDTMSRTTWENIQNAIPLIEDVDVIAIVSNSLHAEKGRAYLWKQRPDLARRLRRADEYRLGELLLVKPFAVLRAGRRPSKAVSIPPSADPTE